MRRFGWALAVLLMTMIGGAVVLVGEEPGEVDYASPVILGVAEDSMLVRVQWTPAPRATYYVVTVGDDEGVWERSVEVSSSPATLVALMDSIPQPAYACVTAWNRHPTRGNQEGGRRCASWTIPGDLLPPGQPGDVQVFPDTVEVITSIVSPQMQDGGLDFRSLGDEVVTLLPVGIPQRFGEDLFLACVDMPSGVRGWLEAGVSADMTELRSVPNPRFWAEPGCEGQFVVDHQDPGVNIEFVDHPPMVPRLTVQPGPTPMLLFSGTTTIRVHDAPYYPSA